MIEMGRDELIDGAIGEIDRKYEDLRKARQEEAKRNWRDDWEGTKYCLNYFASGGYSLRGIYSKLVLPFVGPLMVISDVAVSGIGNGGKMLWASIDTRLAAHNKKRELYGRLEGTEGKLPEHEELMRELVPETVETEPANARMRGYL